MKIAFIGTHGTGKTTLTHNLVLELKNKGKDVDFHGEIAKKCPFPINEATTKKAQIWLILYQILSEIEIEDKSEILISDRSILDSYCYYVNKFGRSKYLEPLVKKHLETYDFLIKIPIRKGFLKKDKIRSINPQFQKDIDNIFNKILKTLKISYLEFKRENISNKEIIEKILRYIKCQSKNNLKEI